MQLEVKTYAKVNLGLYITGKRPDGYHELCSIFLPVELHDVLSVSLLKDGNAGLKITTSGPFAKQCPVDEKNILHKVFKELNKNISVSVNIQKNIPAEAGLGGGSSNAAGFLKALNKLCELNLSDQELKKIAVRVGADVPFFIDSKPALVEGVGDKITPFELKKDYWIVIAKPATGLGTASVYHSFTLNLTLINTNARQTEHLRSLSFQGLKGAGELKKLSNDLEGTGVRLMPEISQVKAFLDSMGPLVTMMSGSGSSVFAIFDREIKSIPEPGRKDWFLCTTKVLRG